MNAQQVIDEMECRFRSEDGIPVKQARITREEWEALLSGVVLVGDSLHRFADALEEER